MRWILRRWLLAGGMRSFLAGYVAGPLLFGLSAAIAERSVAGLLLIVPGVPIMCLLSPLGLLMGIPGMLIGIGPEWGPWDGRLLLIGLAAGVVILAPVGLWLEKRNPGPNGGDATPRVPMARVLTTRRAYLFPAVAWNQLIGPTLLAIAGACLSCLGVIGLCVLGEGC